MPENPRVGSSILSLGTKEIKGLAITGQTLFLLGIGLSSLELKFVLIIRFQGAYERF